MLSIKLVTPPLLHADHSTSTGHNIKWDHFDIVASGQCDLQCIIKETLLIIRDSKPALNVGSETGCRFFVHCCLAIVVTNTSL